MEKPFHILIVDDDIDQIKLLEVTLQKVKYETLSARNGMQALELAISNKFDLILLDVGMPGMDGFEVCKRLKEMPDVADAPVMFLTAMDGISDIVNGFKFGAVDYITKPFYAWELLARVNTHLKFKRSRELVQEKISQIKENEKEIELLNEKLKKVEAEIKTLKALNSARATGDKKKDQKEGDTGHESWIEL